jgi:ABC-type sugar transport system ATPase subunit
VNLPGGVALEGRFSWPNQRRDRGPVMACVRAESIVPGQGGPNGLEAEVISVNFLGAIVNCLLKIGEVLLRADLPARNPPVPGQKIGIRIDPEAVSLITAS